MSEKTWQQLTRDDLDEITVRILREGLGTRPEVRLISLRGELAVSKDYGRNGNTFKRVLGFYLARREVAALRRAHGIRNVPGFLAMPGASSIVMSYVDGVSVTDSEGSDGFDARFFERLLTLIGRLHGCGVAHGDLEKLDNIMITPAGEPALVDFTSAIVSGASPVAALVLPEIMANDVRAVYKLKAELAPDLLTPDEERALHERGRGETWFRAQRRHVRSAVRALSGPRRTAPPVT